MTTPVASPVTLLGNQQPRIVTGPSFDSSPGKEAAELCALAGLDLYPWQKFVLNESLGEVKTPTGNKWAAFEVGLICPRQNGKGPHHVDDKVLTTDGWTTFGDITAGQMVYGADGQPTEVIAVSPIYPDEVCYKVGFTDGSELVVGSGHLWHVYDKDASGGSRAAKPGRWMNMTTAEIAAKRWGSQRTNGRMEYRFRVRGDAVVDTPEADLPIDPYLFGYWLGDGKNNASEITCHIDELPHLRRAITGSGGVVMRETLAHANTWRIAFALRAKYAKDGFLPRARHLGVIGNKHIPEIYLTASIEQRKALLAGLVDSDGSVANTNKSSQIELTSSYPELALGMHRLLRSLGVRVTPREGKSKFNGQEYRVRTRFLWTPTFNPFHLPRKADAVRLGESARQEVMSITGVTPTLTVPTRCIQVRNEDGIYLAGELFTPTHNSVLEARELFGLFLEPRERLILHSAHEFKTASEAFLRVKALIDSSDWLTRKVARMRTSHGEEGIELLDGSRLRFVARSTGSGRGFTADCLILDEAYNLGSSEMAALLPTLGARPNPQVWYTSSAGMITSDQLRAVRIRGRKGGAGRLAYFEWSCPEDCDLNDPENWAQANPTMGYRIGQDFVAAERMALPDDVFARERLGIWAEDNQQTVIDLKLWALCGDVASKPVDRVSFAIDAKPDRSTAAIASSGRREDGRLHTKIVDHRPGMGWVVERLAQLNERYKPVAILLDPAGPAGSLIAELAEVGIEPQLINAREMGQACGAFHDDVINDQLRHADQDTLTSALRQATTRNLGDAWAWDRRHGRGDICPLVAATLATHGFRLHGSALPTQPWMMFE